MQSISETNEQGESAATEKKLKDASTNTNGSLISYNSNSVGFSPSSHPTFSNSKNVTDPTSMFSCPNFQGEYSFQPTAPQQSSFDACLENRSNNDLSNTEYSGAFLQPSWSQGEICYQNNQLRRSPVTHNIKTLNSEFFGNNVRKINVVATKCRSPSDIVYMPTQRSFNSEREFYNACYGGIRSNLDSRLSSSEGSLASSISRSENRYVVPPSRIVELLDLPTIIRDPVLLNQNCHQNVGEHLASRRGPLIGNGIIPTEIRYPKQDVFRLHHKQNATSLSKNDAIRGNRSGPKSVQNSIWIKRTSEELISQNSNCNIENYCTENTAYTKNHRTKNKKCGSIKSFDRRRHNSNTYQQHFENIKTENVNNEMLCTNTSYNSLPGKKSKVITQCDKSLDHHGEYKHDILKGVSGSESDLPPQEQECQYYYTASHGKRVEQSEIENYASKHNYKRKEINEEIINATNGYHKAINKCNNSAQNVPNLNLMDYNHINIVPQSSQKFGSPAVDIILPNQNDDTNGTDIEGKFMSNKQSTIINMDTIREPKESTPPYMDTSISSMFKIPPSLDVDASATRGIIQYTSSKSCLKYRQAFVISTLAFSMIMIMTFSVLYWNYYEALHRRMTKDSQGPGPILDHWGKRAPTEQETRFMANIPAVVIDDVPRGLDKGIGNIYGKKLKKRKEQSVLLEDLPTSLDTEFNVEVKANNYIFTHHITSSSK